MSEWVREGVTDKHSQLSDSGPIKRTHIYFLSVALNLILHGDFQWLTSCTLQALSLLFVLLFQYKKNHIPHLAEVCSQTHLQIICSCECNVAFVEISSCEFSCVSLNSLPERKQSHIGCICAIFLLNEFPNASSNLLPEQMHSRIGCIWTFSQFQ